MDAVVYFVLVVCTLGACLCGLLLVGHVIGGGR